MNYPITCPFCEQMQAELQKAREQRDYFQGALNRAIDTGTELLSREKERTDGFQAELLKLADWLDDYYQARNRMPPLPSDDDRNCAAIQTFCLPSTICEWSALLRRVAEGMKDGWVSAPVEPDDTMYDAGKIKMKRSCSPIEIYKAMISARPKD